MIHLGLMSQQGRYYMPSVTTWTHWLVWPLLIAAWFAR